MKRFSLFIVLALATAKGSVRAQAPGTAEVQAAIDAAWKQHFAAAMKKDKSAIAAIYVAGPVRVDGKPATQVTYNFMAMWQRQPDGTWLLRYLIGQS